MEKASSPIRILLVGQAESCIGLRQALGESQLDHGVVQASGLAEAKSLLVDNTITVVLCERNLKDGTWKSILEHAQEADIRPSIVVCCPHADDYLWAEVLNLGGFDVIQLKPVDNHELVRVIQSAHSHCTDSF